MKSFLLLPLKTPTASPQNALAQEGTILEKAIQHVTQSIAFVEGTTPFLKEDFQSILDKFAEWAYYFKSRAKRQDQLLVQPSVILLEALIDAGEVAYQKEKGYLVVSESLFIYLFIRIKMI
ncbi:hypothetical protein [Candidatus Cardinium hertigii]|uniref:Uncharacterized protein n=1 Tax=Candidatus Cardinium hertigii TaxID=247481 RepID=A0A2Z3L8V4_9BACT|nr:hypothetical protein [Candidatus Cardinium hertigii]AWN81831.1 hypothetical protein DK880_00510 [Candidatus Cardinium hertigii]